LERHPAGLSADLDSLFRRTKKVSLTAEQLQAVRSERWRQKSDPALTREDASAWINTNGICLYLPRRHQFLAPAPSFVEATIGSPSETPAPAALANARGLMIRLVEGGAALPLNLFGALSEQPDFLASLEAFPYIFSLRGGRNWKTPPPKASPLVTAIWKLLEDGASLEVTEIQAGVGHEITESAVLRGLMDLWGGLKVMPLYAEDGPTRWELTQKRFGDALTAANKIAQTTALSVLTSLYLESVIAATPEEIETFLSPLTARSKVREVVNGLAATRQIAIVPVGTQTMYHVAGSLPEFAEPEPVAPSAPVEPPTFTRGRPSRESRDSERRPAFGRDRAGQRPRTGPPRDRFAAGGDRSRPRPAGGARPGGRPGSPGRSSGRPLRTGTDSRGNYPPRRKQFGAAADRPPRPRAEGDRPSYRKPAFGTPGEGEQRPKSYPRKAEGAGGERKPFAKRPFGQRPFNKATGPAKPYGARSAEDRPRFEPRGGKFPPKKFGAAGAKFPPKKFDSDKPRPWKGDARPARSAGSESRPFRPRREEPSGRPRSPRPYEAGKPRGGEKRPFFRDKPNRPGGKTEDRPGVSERPAQRGWKPKPSGFSTSAKPGFGKPKFGGAKFGTSRPAGSKFGGSKPGGPPSRGKFGGKPGFKSGGKPGFKSGPKPGGVKPPFRKRKDKGDTGKSSE
jgi:23S rRNA pseudouridine2605 synthase